ncbi:catechol 2,3-dioxygenase-like lactoylglutathione lyase family enzyme [Dyadobacter jejuensis]|uniref:Catechol 2,3-dioxygenase-like lactoylglutathione lyase family enzyme n=1 Tax=Dyadobacter jejuensis TaxID=1082580 RepID=A0A316AH17_9BACT|nr:VOC family protein [Dyadobacter jejuensis]PWJ56558.1 catechol 2,3-dioxygenase-like lactoylglutathione lyase family enzyme [Dyadobacter jejuensis]
MSNNPLIAGIQQVGIGVQNVPEAWTWYRKVLGFDVPVFDEKAEAPLMTPYTGGIVQKRQAALVLNMAGGGGLEIWSFTSRVSQPLSFKMELGDLGINAIRFKAPDIHKAYAHIKANSQEPIGPLLKLPEGEGFWGQDPYGNIFQVTGDSTWFQKTSHPVGGVAGVVVGVSDMDKSIAFYEDLLGGLETVYDLSGVFDDLPTTIAGQHYRRVLLRKSFTPYGAFSKLLGNTQIELLQALDRSPKKLFKNRFWGDCGYIHLCFDALDMNTLKTELQGKGYPFTVDSESSFGMESAAGRFAYLEDPDGTLIELVETHKVPILKKIGWFMDIQKRKHQKPLPDWMIKTMSFSRVKD